MKNEYERAILKITEFDTANVITTSGTESDEPVTRRREKENVYYDFNSLGGTNAWF